MSLHLDFRILSYSYALCDGPDLAASHFQLKTAADYIFVLHPTSTSP
jgi:hypothetical protein